MSTILDDMLENDFADYDLGVVLKGVIRKGLEQEQGIIQNCEDREDVLTASIADYRVKSSQAINTIRSIRGTKADSIAVVQDIVSLIASRLP